MSKKILVKLPSMDLMIDPVAIEYLIDAEYLSWEYSSRGSFYTRKKDVEITFKSETDIRESIIANNPE